MNTKARGIKSLEQAVVFEDEQFVYNGAAPQRKASNDGAALPGIIETLYSEHRYISSLLDTLEQQAAKLVPGKIADYHLMLDIVDYLTHYPDQFHHPREDLLFDMLQRRDKGFRKQLQRLNREHETLSSYNQQLFEELGGIAAGRRLEQSELQASLARYVAGYRKHMEFESREIFPRAKGKLSAADLEKLDARTRYIDDPIFGGAIEKQYRRLARDLQSRISEFGFDLAAQELYAIESGVEKLSSLAESLEDWRDRLSALSCGRRSASRPSWQARVLNGFTRLTLKPLMRFGSVESARSMTGRLEEQQATLLPEDLKWRVVKQKDYEGEWVNIGRKRPRKIILYFPGGGFIMRTATQHRGLVGKICRAANARALIVHYSLAPEIPFPGGLEDCLAAYHDLLEQGHKPEDITIAGDSAGGGLVLSTLLALRDEGTALPKNAIILSPLADLTYSGKSRRRNKYRDPMLPTHRASQMHELYIGEATPEDRFISPVFADFDGLPPILGQVGSTEILLDDTVRSADQAEAAGVPFFLEVWNEMPHVFPIFGILPEAQVAIDRMAEFIDRSELDPLPKRYGGAR
jgi:acetyl esterase/lipase/hemerythrin-like domain-containing protein